MGINSRFFIFSFGFASLALLVLFLSAFTTLTTAAPPCPPPGPCGGGPEPSIINVLFGSGDIALNLDFYSFQAGYANASDLANLTPITADMGGVCNFSLLYSDGSLASTFNGTYSLYGDKLYTNSSESLSELGLTVPDNYTLFVNCTADDFEDANLTLDAPLRFTRAGIRLYELDEFASSYTRFDVFSIGTAYYDSLLSEAGDPPTLEVITPEESGSCTFSVLNDTTLETILTGDMTYNEDSELYEFSSLIGGNGGLDLPLGTYQFSTRCSTGDGSFETKETAFPFTVKPITCAYTARTNITLEEDAVCSGDEAVANAGEPIITVGEPDLTIDCAGYSITGPSDDDLEISGLYVPSGASGVALKNCSIKGVALGVIAANASNLSISNASLNASASSFLGSNVSNSVFDNVEISGSEIGIMLVNSTNLTLSRLVVGNTISIGMAAVNSLFAVNSSIFTATNLIYPEGGVGMVLISSTFSGTNVTVSNSTVGGLVAVGSNVSLANSTFVNNNATIVLSGSSGLLSNIVIANNSLFGFGIGGSIVNSSNLTLTNNSIAIIIEDSQNNTFNSTTFSQNGLDVKINHTDNSTDVYGNVFYGSTILNSLATEDSTVNSSLVNNVNSTAAVVSFENLTIVTNSSALSLGTFNISNGSGVNWTNGVDMKPAYVSVNSTLAPALNRSVAITFYNVSYPSAGAFEILRDGGLCSDCEKISFSPLVSFNVSGFSNYSTRSENVSPSISLTAVSLTNVTVGGNVCISATASDSGAGISQVSVQVTYPNATVYNRTLADTGVTCAGGASDNVYGADVPLGSTLGTFTVNATFATDVVGNSASQLPNPVLNVTVSPAPSNGGGGGGGGGGGTETTATPATDEATTPANNSASTAINSSVNNSTVLNGTTNTAATATALATGTSESPLTGLFAFANTHPTALAAGFIYAVLLFAATTVLRLQMLGKKK